MALDKVLKVYDDNGNEIDYDILAKDVKFLPDGKDLPTKLAELEDEIGQGGYAPPAGGIPKTDLAQSVQDSLDKADSALQDEDVAEVAKTGDYNDLENKPTIPDISGLATKTELQQGLATKQDALVAGNGIVIGNDGKTVSVAESIRTGAGKGATALQPSDVSVETPATPDGTVDINVGSNTYTINLNHTHENMAKIVKCTEATLPQTLDNDTIYVQVDNATTPTDIECLYLFGLEFTGGGLPAGVPQISKPTPNSTINLGTAYGQGGATGTVKIKGRSLTANSTVVVSVSSGFSLSYGQQSGSSINIDAADVILGCDVTVYATAYGTSGTILITSHTDSLSVEANLTSDVVEDLAGVKLTGTQWLQTDYKPNDKTEFTMDVKFTPNSHTEDYPATGSGVLLRSQTNSIDGKKFFLYLGSRNSQSVPKGTFMLLFINESSAQYGGGYQFITYTSDTNQQEYLDFIVDHSIIQYAIEPSNGRITFSNTSTNRSCITSKKTSTMENGMMIGKHETEGILTRMDFTIYSLEIREQGNVVRRYTAKRRNGVPHLYEEITGTFLRSETAKVSGLAADELVAVE